MEENNILLTHTDGSKTLVNWNNAEYARWFSNGTHIKFIGPDSSMSNIVAVKETPEEIEKILKGK